jgi:hypothetical protein
MIIRQLDTTDTNSVVNIYFDRIDLSKSDNPAQDPAVRQLWIDGIVKYYLTPNNDRLLYGAFDDQENLLSYVGWKMDLPLPYDKDWVIAHLKTREGSVLPSQTGMVKLWEKMFEICEERGLRRWHAVIKDKSWSKFDSFYRRYIPKINNDYEYYDLCNIPPETKPDIDWVWAMIGRRTWPTELRVRTGERKNF